MTKPNEIVREQAPRRDRTEEMYLAALVLAKHDVATKAQGTERPMLPGFLYDLGLESRQDYFLMMQQLFRRHANDKTFVSSLKGAVDGFYKQATEAFKGKGTTAEMWRNNAHRSAEQVWSELMRHHSNDELKAAASATRAA